jgi:hypothetical protein
MRIYKYQLQDADHVKVEIPKGAQLLHVYAQNNKPCIWVLVNEEIKETEIREFRIIDTGQSIDPIMLPHYKYVGTCHSAPYDSCSITKGINFQNNPLVWHIFENLVNKNTNGNV